MGILAEKWKTRFSRGVLCRLSVHSCLHKQSDVNKSHGSRSRVGLNLLPSSAVLDSYSVCVNLVNPLWDEIYKVGQSFTKYRIIGIARHHQELNDPER